MGPAEPHLHDCVRSEGNTFRGKTFEGDKLVGVADFSHTLAAPTPITAPRAGTTQSSDGFMINSVKSCNSFSSGQLLILRELESRTGLAGGFIESDLVDPRYFSPANVKNRIESYLQMIEQKRSRGASVS